MAHFAQLDENNIVTQVIVVSNDDIKDSEGNESELTGIAFCKSLLGPNTIWKQTSYNANIRKNYAGIGFTYDETRDAFISPKPFNSWILNETTCRWEAPVAYPNDGKMYIWNDFAIRWDVGPTTE
jgi:hypothetical protein